MTSSKKNYLDANVFVYAAIQSPQTGEAARYVLEGGVTDSLAIAEAFAAIKRITKNHDASFRVMRRILGQFEVITVDARTVFDAMKHSELHIADAIHFVCSENYNFISFDKDFEKYRK